MKKEAPSPGLATVKERVLERCVRPALVELRSQVSRGAELSGDETAALYGSGGPLDSIDLVRLLILVEEKIRHEFSVSVRLASLKGVVGAARPFSSVGALTEYASGFLTGGKET